MKKSTLKVQKGELWVDNILSEKDPVVLLDFSNVQQQ